jgi:hypothetical protein
MFIKNTVFVILFFASFGASFARPVDLGFAASATPYEQFMKPVKDVLSDLDGREYDFNRIRKLLKIGRSFRYSFTEPYVAALPERTAALRSGDCKAKSLWLIDQLNDRSVRFVIGKVRMNSPMSHAWVMWNDGSLWWILDPTNKREPIRADRVSSGEYVPFYSYGKDGARLHRGFGPVAARSANLPWETVADSDTRRGGLSVFVSR